MKKKYMAASISLLAVIIVCVLCACVPFGQNAPEGISKDIREFSKIKDERMVAEAKDYEGFLFKSEEDVMTFRLKSPKELIDGKVYPMVVFLHGSGDWGTDNSRHMYRSLIDSVDKFVQEDCYVFMPQSVKKWDWAVGNDWTKGGMDILYNKCLDALVDSRPIDTDRIYITGMSMGGNGSMYQAYMHSEKYAAVVSLCGYFPDDVFVDLDRLNGQGIWLAHSRTDDAVDFAESEKLYNRLTSIGRNDVKYTWIDKYKHDITQPVYDNAELWKWLFEFDKNS